MRIKYINKSKFIAIKYLQFTPWYRNDVAKYKFDFMYNLILCYSPQAGVQSKLLNVYQ